MCPHYLSGDTGCVLARPLALPACPSSRHQGDQLSGLTLQPEQTPSHLPPALSAPSSEGAQVAEKKEATLWASALTVLSELTGAICRQDRPQGGCERHHWAVVGKEAAAWPCCALQTAGACARISCCAAARLTTPAPARYPTGRLQPAVRR